MSTGGIPIRGKINNVHGKTLPELIAGVPEIANICRALGLAPGTKPGDPSLRYGKVIFTTDQDVHGSHISGLLLVMFAKFWPELLAAGFCYKFITPVVKVYRGKQEVASFFDEPSFVEWQAAHPGGKPKFFKGLGSTDPPRL